MIPLLVFFKTNNPWLADLALNSSKQVARLGFDAFRSPEG